MKSVGLRLFLESPAAADNATTQLAIFTLEVCLYETVRRQFGLRPDLVVGHSLGEFAAAVASGLLSLGEATVLVACRGRLLDRTMMRTAGDGGRADGGKTAGKGGLS